MIYAVATVKLYLPKVKIKVNGKVITGEVFGKREDFATVWAGANYEFAWSTIVDALNNDRPLLTEKF